MNELYDVVVVGGGPAGLAAAISAYKNGAKQVLVLERDQELGGILNQCIHNGFGLHHFKEELTGPEYAHRFIEELKSTKIQFWLGTMVLNISSQMQDSASDRPIKILHTLSTQHGYTKIFAKSVVLAMGCRERTRGAIGVCGSRPAGVYTAGTVQKMVNMQGYVSGKEVVILGSGDIGLIMARRMVLEGACVKMVLELMPYSNGLNRNIVQCLNDFNIPLMLSHTVERVHGSMRVEGITYIQVDQNLKKISGTEKYIPCDTLLLAVGLIPENELTVGAGVEIHRKTGGAVVDNIRHTSIDGIFACGNVLHVHDIVDFVTEEAVIAGRGAAEYVKGTVKIGCDFTTQSSDGISYVIPHKVNKESIEENVKFYLRVDRVFENKEIGLYSGQELIAKKKAPKFLPAEMIDIVVKKDLLLKIGVDGLIFKII